MKAAIFSKTAKDELNIQKFYGEHRGRICDGQIFDSNNVSILSGGALASTLASRKIDIGESMNLEGVYTYCTQHDGEYETVVTPEWVYKNICPQNVLEQNSIQLPESRILIKDIGKGGKTAAGYRNVLGAFEDGGNTYVLYEAVYNMIDERRYGVFSRIGNAYVWYFYSNASDGGSVRIYALSQTLLDVIDPYGNISTRLVSAERILLADMTMYPYLKSALMSIDGTKTYRYMSEDYTPSIGASYTVNFDNVYTTLYPTLSSYPSILFANAGHKRMVRYSNRVQGSAPFGSVGEKMMILPDRRLLEYSGGAWQLSSESAETMPRLSAAVQYFDRLFGISGDSVYASKKGECADFTEAVDNLPSTYAWRMVTEDRGGFTAIASFGGKVVAFTERSMMTVRGSDLPFTLSHVGDYGCVSQEALAALDGALYFVSPEGVMRYNGSSVKKISDSFLRGANYSLAALTASNGMIVLYNGDGNLWFYEPLSGEWSRRDFDANGVLFTGKNMVTRAEGASTLHALFDGFGAFSFSVAAANKGRRRIKSISVTANIGFNSELTLTDKEGNSLMCISETEDNVVTRTFLPRALYIDNGALHFKGRGDCTIYGIRIEYVPLQNSSRRRE